MSRSYRIYFEDVYGYGVPRFTEVTIASEFVVRDEYGALRAIVDDLLGAEHGRAMREIPEVAPLRVSRVDVLVGTEWRPRVWLVPNQRLTAAMVSSRPPPDGMLLPETWPR